MIGRSLYRGALLAGLLCHIPAMALAKDGDCSSGDKLAAAGTVAALGHGGTLILDDGQVVTLSSIAMPPGDGALGETARAALSAMVLGRPIALAQVGKADRHARLPAHVFVIDGAAPSWVQQQLVAKGLARVQSFKETRACVPALLAAESGARRDRRGVWDSPDFAVRATAEPEVLSRFLDTYQIVEGEVLSTGASGRRVYLNFGRRWKTDFTGVIATRDLDAFADAGIFPLKLPRRRVRLRGWLSEHDGPMMVLDHPQQIELIEDGNKGK